MPILSYVLAHGSCEEVDVIYLRGRVTVITLKHSGCCMGVLLTHLTREEGRERETERKREGERYRVRKTERKKGREGH